MTTEAEQEPNGDLFTLTLRTLGEFADDGSLVLPSDAEVARARQLVRGLLAATVEAQLPTGFALDVHVDASAGTQRELSPAALEAAENAPRAEQPDRLAQIETGVCRSCHQPMTRQGPGLPWFHDQQCPNPEPGGDLMEWARVQIASLQLRAGQDVLVLRGSQWQQHAGELLAMLDAEGLTGIPVFLVEFGQGIDALPRSEVLAALGVSEPPEQQETACPDRQ